MYENYWIKFCHNKLANYKCLYMYMCIQYYSLNDIFPLLSRSNILKANSDTPSGAHSIDSNERNSTNEINLKSMKGNNAHI